uniref:Putative secreted peptide n=1 Tax=Anopheles braziliensis TaxID=58242 RepID=A0A2M3ZRA9_9DIPT
MITVFCRRTMIFRLLHSSQSISTPGLPKRLHLIYSGAAVSVLTGSSSDGPLGCTGSLCCSSNAGLQPESASLERCSELSSCGNCELSRSCSCSPIERS